MTLLVVAAPAVAGLAVGTAASSDAAQTKVDVVFVFDRSESTNDERYHMAQEIGHLQERFEDANVDARYGLVTYAGTAQTQQGLTSDFEQFERAMVFPERGNEEHASEAILHATGLSFREDAKTVVVLVTDEDDDSTNATRDRAIDALSGHEFIAVSPASPAESSCDVHSPPCDDRNDNELRTVAGAVGGDWIDVTNSAETIVQDVAAEVLRGVSSGSGGGDGGSSDAPARPAFEPVETSLSHSTAEVGDPVTVEATVENVGDAYGEYDAFLSIGGEIVAEKSVEIAVGERDTVSFVHRFDAPGEYDILVRYETVGTVTVTEPRAEQVETVPTENGSGISASVTDARTNGSVTVATNGTQLVPEAVGSITGVVLSVGDTGATPSHDVAFNATVRTNETPPNGTPALYEYVTDVRYLTVDTELGSALTGIQFEYTPGAEETTLYRYDAANATWLPVAATAVNGTNGTLRTQLDANGVYAVGIRQSPITVTEIAPDRTTMTVGESMGVAVTVENVGIAAETLTVTLRADDAVIGTANVSVPANDSRTLTFTYRPETTGTVTLDAGDNVTASVSVNAPETQTTTTVDPDTATEESDQTDVSGKNAAGSGESSSSPLPGFGVGAALVALLVALVLARRRT